MARTEMLKVLLLVVGGLVLAVRGHSCPSNWVLHNGNCYGFSQGYLTWAEALAFCRANGGTLVEPRDASLNSWLKQELRARHMSVTWIGANDHFREGHFEWVSDQTLLGFRDFPYGLPDDHQGYQECVCLFTREDWRWDDNFCHKRLNFVCQKKPDEQHQH